MRSRLSVLLALAILPSLANCKSATSSECTFVAGVFNPQTPQLILQYRGTVDPTAETDTLAARYGFVPVAVWPDLRSAAIPAPQPQSVLNGLVCEPSILYIWYNKPDSTS